MMQKHIIAFKNERKCIVREGTVTKRYVAAGSSVKSRLNILDKYINTLSSGITIKYLKTERQRLEIRINNIDNKYLEWLRNTPKAEMGKDPLKTYQKETSRALKVRQLNYIKKLLNEINE